MKVLTIGGAMVDTVAIVDDALIERISLTNAGKSFLLLEQGGKTEVVAISTHCGGGGMNSAVAFRRLGFEVAPLIKIGRDVRGEAIEDVLRRERISDRWVLRTDAAPTGASTVISAHDRDAAVFTFRGSNSLLDAADLQDEMFDVDVGYVAPLSGQSADILPVVAGLASKRNALLIINPGIRQITTRFQAMLPLFPIIDVFVVNRLEAEAAIDQAVIELSKSEDPNLRLLATDTLRFATASKVQDRQAGVKALLSGLLGLGCRKVLLTDGRNGAYFAAPGQVLFEPAQRVDVVGTAGAGDAFASTFAASTVSGDPPEAALRAAAANAASVVTFADAQTGLLRLSDLKKSRKSPQAARPRSAALD